MKIHIVQKGDTLWDLSKKYGVDFEELKQANPQLSSPDMIMPGMKIKIPSTSKVVKKETAMPAKETQKKKTQHPYQDHTPKPMPVMKEDDHVKKMMPKPEMPVQPMQQTPVQPIMQPPIMEQELQNYTMINFPQMPQYHHEEIKEKPKKEHVKAEAQPKPKKEHVKAEAMPQFQPQPQPQFQPLPYPMPQPQVQPMQQQGPMLPLCCHVVHPCHPPVPFPLMVNPEMLQMQQGMPFGQLPVHGLPSNMEMADNPMHMAGNNDCGCRGNTPMPQFEMPQHEYVNNYQESNQPMSHVTQTGMLPGMYPPQFATNENRYPYPPEYPNISGTEEADETAGE